MSNMLYGALALISAIIGIVSFVYYQRNAETTYFVVAVVFILVALGLGAMFLSSRVNKTDDIHITE